MSLFIIVYTRRTRMKMVTSCCMMYTSGLASTAHRYKCTSTLLIIGHSVAKWYKVPGCVCSTDSCWLSKFFYNIKLNKFKYNNKKIYLKKMSN